MTTNTRLSPEFTQIYCDLNSSRLLSHNRRNTGTYEAELDKHFTL